MYLILVESRALQDIQSGIDYYNGKQSGLGSVFESAIDKEFDTISKNPFYQIRYSSIRCKSVKKFPYLIHFQLFEKEKIIKIFAVINTNRDPKKYWLK